MTGPAEFLTARLDEDEHWAHMAEAGWPPENALAASEDPEHYPFMATDITPSKAAFIRRHDPGRVLREVAAKRAILAEHVPVIPDYGPDKGRPCCGRCGAVGDDAYLAIPWPCATVRAFLAVYSDHPGYDPAWG